MDTKDDNSKEEDQPQQSNENLKKMISLGDYKGEDSVELAFKEGDIILVLEEHKSGW